MLIQTNPNARGDRKLSPREALLAKFEETERAVRKFRLDDHDLLKDKDARLGKPMAHTELIRRVVKMNPNVWAEDSINDRNCVGFYTTGPDGKKKYLVAFEKGILPEFSYILVDRADLPVKEKRGYRTVLHRLLLQNAVKWRDVLEAFGDTGINEVTARWRHNTHRFRQQ